jgi:diguanylate cyclase (GGDEF)-like protein/PAS domain S-box-containing protein
MSSQSTPSARRPGLYCGAFWLYPLLVAGSLAGRWGGAGITGIIAAYDELPLQLVAIVLVVQLLARGSVTGYRRLAWILLLGAIVCDTVAGVAWGTATLSKGSLYANWVDVPYILYYPLFAGACVLLFLDLGGSFRRRHIWLDLATFALGLGSAFWVLLVVPAAAAPGHTVVSFVTTLSYSTGYMVMMSGAALLFMQVVRWKSESSTMLLLGSAICMMVTDSWWTAEQIKGADMVGSLIDVGYCFNYAFLTTAAVLEGRRVAAADAASSAEGNVYSFLPVLAVLFAILLLFGKQVSVQGSGSTALLAIVTLGAGLVVVRQLTVRKNVERLRHALASREAEARLTELVRRSSDLIAVVNADDKLAYVSPASWRVLGVAPEALQHSPAATMLGQANEARLGLFLEDLKAQGSAQASGSTSRLVVTRLDVELTTPAGDRHVLQVIGSDHRTSTAIAGLTLTIRDVTEHKRLEEQLRALAFYDPLTLLANRSLFADRVHHAVNRIADGLTPAVLFIDLDNFKTINDGLGHGAGDQLLRACAQRIVQGTRAADTVARLGGDEFAVLLDNAAGTEAAMTVANHILTSLSAPIEIDGRELRVAASIGICLAGPQTTADHLLRNADAAMYRAKALGKGRAVLFEAEMAKAARRRLLIEQELAGAVERGELFVHYQPIVDIKSMHLIGVEALMRWQHPTRGVVMPGEFIPIAEETGQIVPMTQWILRQACQDAATLRRAVHLGNGLRLAVNVSGRYLQHHCMTQDVSTALADSGIDPGSLLLEVTESLLLLDSPELAKRFAEIKALGVRLALDDFGTGYSSLAYLHRYPLDVLKIDRSFIQQLSGEDGEKSRDATALAKAILSLAAALGLDTVAEGIELESQREALIRLGCTTGQGYAFGMPMPIGELLTCHAARRREVLVENLSGPIDFTATGRFRRVKS